MVDFKLFCNHLVGVSGDYCRLALRLFLFTKFNTVLKNVPKEEYLKQIKCFATFEQNPTTSRWYCVLFLFSRPSLMLAISAVSCQVPLQRCCRVSSMFLYSVIS